MFYIIALVSCLVMVCDRLGQSLLGDRSHRLLSAAQAAKMAVVYSQYTSLYVLTNVVRCFVDSSHFLPVHSAYLATKAPERPQI